MNISDTMKNCIYAIADLGGHLHLNTYDYWQRPRSLRDFKPQTFRALEKRGLLTVDKELRDSPWSREEFIKTATLTAKGWGLTKFQYRAWSRNFKWTLQKLVNRQVFLAWLIAHNLTLEDISLLTMICERFDIDRSVWKVNVRASYNDPTQFHVYLESRNLKVRQGEVFFENSPSRQKGAWLYHFSETCKTPDKARQLADLLLDAARIAEALSDAADEQGYITLS